MAQSRAALPEILFLAHRIPYPPNKGDKIRSFNLLKYLAESYRVHLGAFVDDPDDWRHEAELRPYCAELCLLPLDPTFAKLRSLKGLLAGTALSLPYYADPRMGAWVASLLGRAKLRAAFVFSSAMAQYLENAPLPKVIDFVDVDSDKWRQYAAKKPWPARWIYQREAERLLDFDRRVAGRFDHSLFVSQPEAELFLSLAPEAAGRVHALENGVDTAYFDPCGASASPYPEEAKVLAFTGAMDYWANVDAVVWFADAVFPGVLDACPEARFYVVGSRPSDVVRELGSRPGIVVTGAVPDIRPYLKHAHAAVAPLRIARGVQNKVLEALAMAKPVLASPQAWEGIAADDALDAQVLDAPEEWQAAALGLLGGVAAPLESVTNRAFVEQRYGWRPSLARLCALLESL